MKKVKGKALSLVLSLALVISSFSAIPASAATKTLSGSLGGNDNDSIYLVNGGADDAALTYKSFGTYVSDDPTMTTPNHKDVSDVHIAAVSHKSGDRLVKWFDAGSQHDKTDSISEDTDDQYVDLRLRSSSVSGTEVISLLYKGTYTDDDDNEYTVKATQDVTVRVYDKNETVVGEYGDAGKSNIKGELDSSFAQKTVDYETSEKTDADANRTDSKKLTVLKAVPSTNSVVVKWVALKTVTDGTDAVDAYYTLKSNSDNVKLGGSNDSGATYSGDGEADATRPGVDTSDAGIHVTAPLNDYTFKYTVKHTGDTDASAPKDVTDGVISDLADGDEVTLTPSLAGEAKTPVTFTYTAATEAAPASMADVAQTDSKPGLAFDADAKLISITEVPEEEYTYVYTTDGVDPTAGSDAVPEAGIDTSDFATDEDTTVKVAAVSENSIVAGSIATGTYKPATVVAAATIAPAVSASGYTVDVNEDNDVAVTVEAVTGATYKYSVNGATETVVPSGDTIPLSSLNDGDDVKVTAYKDNAAIGSASGIYRAATSESGDDYVTAQVAGKAGTGNVTFTAVAQQLAKDAAKKDAAEEDAIHSSSDIKVKSSVDKKILVANSGYTTFSKYSTSTYLYTGAVDSSSKDDAVKVTGYEVNFNNSAAAVSVDDKASVTKISGTVKSISVAEGNVGSIAVSNDGSGVVPSVIVSDAKVGDVDFAADGGTLEVNSTDSVVGNVTDASKVTVTNGTVGNIDADEADVSAEDEDGTVKVGNVTAPVISVDSDNSKVATGTLKATSDDTEITLSGDFVTVAGVDFDNWGAELKIDGFTGTVPAPKNATEDGATISTNATEDKVTIDGDADINSIAIGDDSQMIFNGKLNVGSVDGSGTLVVGLGKMDISSDASGVTLKFSDPAINVGDTAFTAVTDTVDVDSMEPYGCTLSMTEGSKEDTFKIASTDFVGMTFNPSSARIANGYSQTFAASTYAPGTALPEGYSVQYTLDGDDDIFQMTNNDDGTVTVKVVGYDDTFAEENTATLRAEVVDTDGDVDDDYSAGELDLTALAVPDSTFKSDTGSTLSIGGGFTYQFAITSLDGNVPYFAVAGSSFKTTYVGNSGNTYYYKVTAVGKVGDAAGVYINHGATPSTVITITNPSDTAAVTVKAGGSYQFRVNGPSQPVFQVAGIGNIALTSKAGSNYYFKVNVPTNLAKGGHGVYNNGVRVAILTVA